MQIFQLQKKQTKFTGIFITSLNKTQIKFHSNKQDQNYDFYCGI
jgi:hypothetical protein